jgi:hypothetical protein
VYVYVEEGKKRRKGDELLRALEIVALRASDQKQHPPIDFSAPPSFLPPSLFTCPWHTRRGGPPTFVDQG